MSDLNISLIGDIFPGNMDYNIGFGIASIFNESGFIWKKQLKDYFNGNDIVIGNFEAPLLNLEKIEKLSFAGDPKFLTNLTECGINVLNVANNHILEYGENGFLSTLKYIEENKIWHIGSYKQNENPLIIDINNLKIGIAGFNQVHDIPNPNKYIELDFDACLKTIDYYQRKEVDFIILSIHWGWHQEYVNIPSPDVIKLAHKLIDSGVDIIHGHHSHSIQPIEFYKNGIIFYSLGNFIFDMFWSKNVRTGLVAKINIDRKKQFTVQSIKSRMTSSNILQRLNVKKYNDNYQHNSMKLYNLNIKLYSFVYKFLLSFSSFSERIKMKIFIIKNWSIIDSEVKKRIFQKFKRKLNVG